MKRGSRFGLMAQPATARLRVRNAENFDLNLLGKTNQGLEKGKGPFFSNNNLLLFT